MRNPVRREKVSLFVPVMLALALLASACGQKAGNSSAADPGDQTGGPKQSLVVANEAAAIRTLQTIYRAQTQYMLSHAEEYGTFNQLVRDNHLDQRFAATAPVVEGYVFTIKLTPKSSGEAAAYSVTADPQGSVGARSGGARHLYMDSSSNVVRANALAPAMANDPPIQ
jgi:hypothetical protein